MSERSPFRLDGRVVAVIGAGSGIGEASAQACAAQGAHVACLDVAADRAEAVAARLRRDGASAESGAVDVRDADGVDAVLAGLAARRDALDAVVVTPAINIRKKLLDYTSEEFELVVQINLQGTFHALRAAGRLMAPRRRGSIVLLSSIRSQVVEPGQGPYAASKAGIVQLARTAACELGPSGVRVNAVAPGVVETPLTQPILQDPSWRDAYSAKSALGRWARPVEIGAPVAFLCSDAASFVTGTVLFVDGGWTAVDGRFDPPGMGPAGTVG